MSIIDSNNDNIKAQRVEAILEDPQAQQQANYTRVNKAKTIKATMTGKYLGIIAIPIIFLCSLFFAAVVLGGLACLTVFKIVSNRWRPR